MFTVKWSSIVGTFLFFSCRSRTILIWDVVFPKELQRIENPDVIYRISRKDWSLPSCWKGFIHSKNTGFLHPLVSKVFECLTGKFFLKLYGIIIPWYTTGYTIHIWFSISSLKLKYSINLAHVWFRSICWLPLLISCSNRSPQKNTTGVNITNIYTVTIRTQPKKKKKYHRSNKHTHI